MHPIATMCRALEVFPSGYNARQKRPPSVQARADEVLSARIAAIHQRSRATYGTPCIHAELQGHSIRVGQAGGGAVRRKPTQMDDHHRA
jgi:putative transposase